MLAWRHAGMIPDPGTGNFARHAGMAACWNDSGSFLSSRRGAEHGWHAHGRPRTASERARTWFGAAFCPATLHGLVRS
eukprot:7390820-Prymnesium_polylepis.2